MDNFDRDAFDEIFSDLKIDVNHDDYDECKHNFLFVDGFYTCTNCGIIDTNKIHSMKNSRKIIKVIT